MKFSVKVEYGLQALMELAINYGGGPVQIADIARGHKIPIRFLEQIMLMLKRNKLVVSTRGKHGGYSMAKHPSDVPVLDAVEALDGLIELTTKRMSRIPVIFEAFLDIQKNIKKELTALTLEDLVMRKRQKDRAYTYNI